jgi:hypothetical protein
MHLAIGEDKFINKADRREGMASEELLAYCRALLRNGYSEQQVRASLASGGYRAADIEDAFAVLHQQTAITPSARPPWLWIAGVVLGLAVGGVLVALLLSTGQAPAVTLLSRPVEVELFAGSTLDITNTVTAQQGTFTLVQTLLDKDGSAVASSRQDAAVNGKTTVPTTLGIPSTLDTGRYQVKVSAIDASGKETSAQFYISVQQRSVPQVQVPANVTPTPPIPPVAPTNVTPVTPEQPAPLECPGGCNDYDPTTDDACVSGQCTHTPKPQTCGDNVCDGDETSATCPQDCGAGITQPSADEVIEQARTTAPGDSERAMGLCNALPRPQDADRCRSVVASSADNSALCANIGDDVTRDQCYIDFAIRKNQFDVCEKIANRYLRGSCNSLRNLRELELQRINETTVPEQAAPAAPEQTAPTETGFSAG